jgi:hypothetical protein
MKTIAFYTTGTVNSRLKKDLNLQIHLHKVSHNWFLYLVHKSFLNQTTLNLGQEKRSFLNREFTVQSLIHSQSKQPHFQLNILAWLGSACKTTARGHQN